MELSVGKVTVNFGIHNVYNIGPIRLLKNITRNKPTNEDERKVGGEVKRDCIPQRIYLFIQLISSLPAMTYSTKEYQLINVTG